MRRKTLEQIVQPDDDRPNQRSGLLHALKHACSMKETGWLSKAECDDLVKYFIQGHMDTMGDDELDHAMGSGERFTTENGFSTSISITGTGIVNNSSNAPTFIVGNQANIFFRNASTAGNAIMITNAGGLTAFVDSATGGNARFITNAGGAFDITSLSSGGMTAGSIEGAGTFSLGSNQLTVGSNNLSTEVSRSRRLGTRLGQ
jgi:hypothetical protein